MRREAPSTSDKILERLHNQVNDARTLGTTAIAKAEGKAQPYNDYRIAWELERTALGDGFYGNALRVAKDIPGITADDRSLLDRYATGRHTGTDHVKLQDLALRIDAIAKAEGKAS